MPYHLVDRRRSPFQRQFHRNIYPTEFLGHRRSAVHTIDRFSGRSLQMVYIFMSSEQANKMIVPQI